MTGMPPAIEPVTTSAPLSELEQEGLDYRRRYRGLIGVGTKVPIRDRAILSLVYTPGVAEACLEISDDPLGSFDLTCRGNTVAILTDGSDIFGREGGPPEAAHPDRRRQERHLQDVRRGRRLPDLPGYTTIPARSSRPASRSPPTFGAICIDDISTPRAFTDRRPSGKGGRHPGLLQPAPRHGHPRARRPDQRAQGGRQAARGRSAS